MEVVVLAGVSGSGKSTLARKLAAQVREDGLRVEVVSADDYFIRMGPYEFNPAKLPEAHADCFRRFLGALISRVDVVIVDNTNTTPAEVAPYMLAAASFRYYAEIKRIKVDVDVAAGRNIHGVPPTTVRAQHERLERSEWPPHWFIVEVEAER